MFNLEEFIKQMREAQESLFADCEREFLFQRSSDRYNTVTWLLDTLEQRKFPTKEEIYNAIIYGRK